jgi:hypothetical protein
MYRLGWLPIHDPLHFARIHGDTILGNIVTQEFHTIQLEFTFGEFSIKLVISQTLQNDPKMFRVLFFIFGKIKDIINEDHHELVQLIHED